jgi:transcriptional regulator with XRE-family HTH domain
MKTEKIDLWMDKETTLEHIGSKIYNERIRQKITIASLANSTMLSEGYIRSIEKGRYACSVINFLKICNVLKINFNEILNENKDIEMSKFSNKNVSTEKSLSSETEKINRINNKILENILNQNKNIKICAVKYMKEKI